MALEGAALLSNPEYFAKVEDEQIMFINYSLTADQLSFLDFLVPLKPSSWNTQYKEDYSVHSHSLV